MRDSYRYEDAERAAVEAVERVPRNPQLHVLHGWVLSDVDRDDEAVAAAERALAIDPRHSWALTSRIDFLKYLRRYEDAERAAAEALERRSDDPGIHVAVGRLYHHLDRYQEALDAFERALAIDPRDAGALFWQVTILRDSYRYEDAERAAVEAVERVPRNPQLHVLHGWVLSDVDRDDEAVAAAERALAIDPRHSWALTSRIDFLTYIGRYQDAERAAAEALERRSDNPGIHVAVGRLYYYLDRPAEAFRSCEMALTIDPRDTDALYWRVLSLQDLRWYDKAERFAVEAVERVPRNPQLHVLHGWVLSDVDRDDEAVAAAERALAIDPRHSWALTSRIDFLKYLRRYEDAERAAAEALERRSDDPGIHVAVGRLYHHLDRYQEALDAFERALAIDPRDAGALQRQVTTLRTLHRYEDAERAARDAVTRRPGIAILQVELGGALDDQLRFDDALAVLAATRSFNRMPPTLEVARSKVLRSLHRCGEAERDIVLGSARCQ